MLTLRRSAWMRWLPPIESASPSPVTTQTERSGRVGGEPGRDGGRATVDRVHPVRLHVVREARGAADAGDEDDALARDAELGHELLDGGEDRVVAAARAPADFLVGLQVLRGQRQLAVAVAFGHSMAPIASASSLARNGTPRTRL